MSVASLCLSINLIFLIQLDSEISSWIIVLYQLVCGLEFNFGDLRDPGIEGTLRGPRVLKGVSTMVSLENWILLQTEHIFIILCLNFHCGFRSAED